MSYRVGIDVGGTFTDLFLWSADGGVETFKVLSTPEDPSLAVIRGLEVIAGARGLAVRDFAAALRTIVHGTTVTTNATLTRRGARTGLLTTRGVRDALEMRRGIREQQYDNRSRNVEPLAPRRLRRTVNGRLDGRGEERTPLDEDEVRREALFLREQGVEAVAICFMNAFANPAHEQRAALIAREVLPHAFVSVSTEVLPTLRFYNRLSTTVLGASVGPVLTRYLERLGARLTEAGFAGVLLIMQSTGGVASPEATIRQPAQTLLSGPAAGPRAAARFVGPDGDGVLVDMGGTSFDASLVQRGVAATNRETDIDRLRVALPMLAITTIGAGGGSIAWLDEGGMLRMGPQSAGALPGPACYGRGGELPTCTDANLVLGYLDAGFFAGGAMALDADAARRAIADSIAKALGMSVEEAAAGMYRVINATMAFGVREVTAKRGLDPREFPLVVAGGAAALHACEIARELNMTRLIVPATASVLCAAGMLFSDLQHDYARALVSPLSDLDPTALAALVDELTAQGRTQLRDEGVPLWRIEHHPSLDLRYKRQYHEVMLPVPREIIARGDFDAIRSAFHAEHNRLYGYDLAEEGAELELITVRLCCVGRVEEIRLPTIEPGGADPGYAGKGRRRAFLPRQREFAPVPLFDGHRLLAGAVIEGPALVERTDTTLFIGEGFTGRVDAHAGILITAGRQDDA